MRQALDPACSDAAVFVFGYRPAPGGEERLEVILPRAQACGGGVPCCPRLGVSDRPRHRVGP